MTRDERDFIERKRSLVKYMVKLRFEDRLYDELLNKDFGTVEELDSFFDNKLRKYDEEQDWISDYYDSILACDEDNMEDEDDEDEDEDCE